MRISAALTFLLAETFVASHPLSPSVDGDLESVPYETVRVYEGYEERRYTNVVFACTELVYMAEKEGGEMFNKLFGYISGFNSEAQEIELTVPVISKLVPSYNMMHKAMCFYLPKKFQENPPQAIDKDVYIVKIKEWVVFVKNFGGFAMRDSVWVQNAASFINVELAEKAGEVMEGYFFTASYDSPTKLGNRRNEVMFEKSRSHDEV